MDRRLSYEVQKQCKVQSPCPQGAYILTDTKLTNSISYHPCFYFSFFWKGVRVMVDSTSYFHITEQSCLGRVKLKTGCAEQKQGLADPHREAGLRKAPLWLVQEL